MADSDSNSPQDLLTFDEDEHTWLPLPEETDAGSKRRRSNGTDDILPEPSMRILMTKLMDVLHSLCNGPYADGQNPMLFLSNWGLAAGRPLAIIPTLPFLVWEGIRLWDM